MAEPDVEEERQIVQVVPAQVMADTRELEGRSRIALLVCAAECDEAEDSSVMVSFSWQRGEYRAVRIELDQGGYKQEKGREDQYEERGSDPVGYSARELMGLEPLRGKERQKRDVFEAPEVTGGVSHREAGAGEANRGSNAFAELRDADDGFVV